MKVKLQIINSFSIQGTGGNPAGVVLDADALSSRQKQQIAASAGLSETAFVSTSTVADFKLDFFTPVKQIPHCGHATIATFWYLKSLGRIPYDHSSKETINGTRKIFFRGEEAFMEQLAPRFESVKDADAITNSLGLVSSSTLSDFPPIVGNTGNSFILVRVKDPDDLRQLTPDFDRISALSSDHKSIGYHVYAVSSDQLSIQTRMFAPLYGINEESATGMAAGPLAGFLYPELKRRSFFINQGKYMSPPSESKLNVILSTNDSLVTGILVGGSAYISKTTEINI